MATRQSKSQVKAETPSRVAARHRKLKTGTAGALAVRPPGRPAGTPNKVSAQAKDNILQVFQRLGGVTEMTKWAKANKTIFYSRIYARLLPKDVTVGADAGLEDLLADLAASRNTVVEGEFTEVGDTES